jgi:outer membrane receptor for Fe3+-dicitrate
MKSFRLPGVIGGAAGVENEKNIANAGRRMMERYKLEKRSWIWAIYDTEHPEYHDKSKLDAAYPWIVAYWEAVCVDGNDEWVMVEFKKSQAKELLALLNGKKDQPEDLDFNTIKCGDKIEVRGGDKWTAAVYISINSSGFYTHWVLFEYKTDPVSTSADNIRLPIKWRMERGQPLIVNGGYLRTFASIDRDYMYVFADDLQDKEKVNTWRLPTKRELQGIGHDGLGWLTEGE